MEKKWLLGIFVLAFVLSASNFSSATVLNLETYPSHNVEVRILMPDQTYSLVDSFYGNSDSEGKYTLSFESSVSDFDLGIWIKQENLFITKDRFEDLESSEDTLNVVLFKGVSELTKGSSEPNSTSNETQNSSETSPVNSTNETVAEQNSTNETASQNPRITGLATSEDSGSSGKTLYYILGIVALFIVLFLGVAYKSKLTNSGNKDIKVKKLSEVNKEKEKKLSDYEKQIEEAEKKIDEAKKEIEDMKKSRADKIAEAKKKLIEDEKELMRLRKGED